MKATTTLLAGLVLANVSGFADAADLKANVAAAAKKRERPKRNLLAKLHKKGFYSWVNDPKVFNIPERFGFASFVSCRG